MHQKGFKEILPGNLVQRFHLKSEGSAWVCHGSVMGPNNLSHNIILANHKIILLLLIIN